MNTYEIITNRIIEKMEQGYIPWRKPWKSQMPRNLVSKQPYHGINLLLLSMSEYDSPYWLTFNQAKKLGGSINKGERGTPVIFWKLLEVLEKEDDSEENKARTISYLQYSTVFNLHQTEGVARPSETIQVREPLPACEKIAEGFKDRPETLHSISLSAFYRVATDTVYMPPKRSFTSPKEYYSTLFHEYIHSTGHEKRLNRHAQENTNFDFGTKEYSREELVAELGSAFLCAEARIDNSVIENNTAYLQSWLQVFQNDKKIPHSTGLSGKWAAAIG
jgi:antirestriction protein ArdC